MKKEKIISWLDKNIKNELDVARFYEENLHMFTSKKEQDAVKKLVLESLAHAARLINAKHRLGPSAKKAPGFSQKLKVLERAMKEEKGMEDIYKYEAKKTGEKKTADILISIAKMEVQHQKIVNGLAKNTVKNISEKKAKSILKRLKPA
jgi:rubrerythrin